MSPRMTSQDVADTLSALCHAQSLGMRPQFVTQQAAAVARLLPEALALALTISVSLPGVLGASAVLALPLAAARSVRRAALA